MTHITKLKKLPRSVMKAKGATRLVGQVLAGDGITVTKASGNFTVTFDSADAGVVIAPPTNTDNAIARWDGADSGTLQDSSVLISDAGIMTGGTWQGERVDLDYIERGSTIGYHLSANGSGTASSYEGFLQAGTGAATRTWQDKARDFVNGQDFGVVPNSAGAAAANTTALNAALVAHKRVRLQAGTWYFSGVIVLPGDGSYIIGDGPNATILMATTASTALVRPAAAITSWGLFDLTLDRNITATSGGYGVDQRITNTNGRINNVVIKNQYIGANLGPCGYSYFTNSEVYNCISHPIAMESTDTGGSFQWNLTNVLIGTSGGYGIYIDSAGSADGVSCGQWTHIATFANEMGDIGAFGSALKSINAIRLTVGFFGGSAGHASAQACVVLDTYGGNSFPHTFTDLYIEASTKPGVLITANNGAVILTNPEITGMTTYGVRSSGSLVSITGGSILNTASSGIGVSIAVGASNITGTVISNGGGAAQVTGVSYAASTGPHTLVGCDFLYGAGNATAALSDSSANANNTIRGNKGVPDRYANGSYVADANGNELIIMVTASGAVNEITYTNAATGSNPKFSATGGDPNIGIDFQGKGTGVYNFLSTSSGPTEVRLFEHTANGSNFVGLSAPASIASNRALVLPDASDTLVGKATTDTFTNKSISGSTNTITNIPLGTAVTGDLAFSNLTQGSALSVLGVTGNATADFASIAAGSDHQTLRRSGTSLAFGALNLAQSAAVTGTLAVGNGGTGITAFGTGVATALGVNVGSAGAFVTNGGALGTPSSGTLTNATGLPYAGISAVAWENYTPTISHTGGGTYAATGDGWFIIIGKIAFVVVHVTGTSFSAPTGALRATLPGSGSVKGGRIGLGNAYNLDAQMSGVALGGAGLTTAMDVYRYDGAFPASANSQNIWIFSCYEVA